VRFVGAAALPSDATPTFKLDLSSTCERCEIGREQIRSNDHHEL
jgi:hypothetical protein